MRRGFGILAMTMVMALAGGARAQVPSVAGGLDEALRSLDAAVASLEKTKGSPGKDRALQHLATARVRLVDALNALGGVAVAPAGAVVVGTPGGGASVVVGGPGGASVHVVVNDPAPPPPPAEVDPGPQPMEPGRFQDLLRALKDLSFSRDQLNYLRDAARHHWFLADQVRQVVAGFDFGKDKVDAAALLYRRVLDRENFYQVQDALDFESDREALRKRIRD
jgi:hypothetical protein